MTPKEIFPLLRCVARRLILRRTMGLTPVAQSIVEVTCQRRHFGKDSTAYAKQNLKLLMVADENRKLSLVDLDRYHHLKLYSDSNLTAGANNSGLSISNSPDWREHLTLRGEDLIEGESQQTLPDVEEFGIDILAEMDDPPVLHDYAYLPLPPLSYTLSSYVEHSETLQKLVQMGVDLSKVEKRKKVPSKILKMDFESDIKDKLVFLNRVGVQGEDLGKFVTKNPFILLENNEELQSRVGYLKSKKFTDEAIAKIINRAPYFLSFSVLRVDRKLGYLQQLLKLKGSEVREVITREPRLVTHKVSRIQENVFILREQLGFRRAELKSLIVQEPKLLLRGKYKLIGTFDYMHNVMDISHKMMLSIPWVLHARLHKLQERHQYLKSLRRDIYDPKQPQYVPLSEITRLPDYAFCEEIAKTSLEHYNSFLKSL